MRFRRILTATVVVSPCSCCEHGETAHGSRGVPEPGVGVPEPGGPARRSEACSMPYEGPVPGRVKPPILPDGRGCPRPRAARLPRAGSPGAGAVVLHEAPVHVLARLAADNRVVDAGGAVHEVERGVPSLGGDPQLLVVGALVGDPAGV